MQICARNSTCLLLYTALRTISPKTKFAATAPPALRKNLDYLKMKKEWEKNKPALNEECQKIFEDKLKEIEQTVKECLATSDPNTDLTVCDFDAMCPEYGVDSKCSYKYTCNDGVTCRRTEGETNLVCTDKQGEKTTYTKKDFDKKYYTKENY